MRNEGWLYLDNHLEKLLEDIFLSKYIFLTIRKDIETWSCSKHLVSFQYSIHPCWAHLSGSNACVRVLLCSIKGRRPLEKAQARRSPGWAEDRLIHTERNTPHSGRRVLRSGGPNHSKSLEFLCSCPQARSA